MGVEVDPSWWTSGLWEGRPIREYLQRRDIAATFRFLHARGFSYGAISSLVGISANRVAEVAKGVRQVTAYEVLERIAVGLCIPRVLMGLGQEQDVDASQRGGPGRSPGQDWLPAGDGDGGEVGSLARLRNELDEALGGFSPADNATLASPDWDILIVGRSVTEAVDPAAAATRFAQHLAAHHQGNR